MRRLGLLLLVTVCCTAWAVRPSITSSLLSPAPVPGTLLVANKADDTLYFVDAETLAVTDSTTTGRGPHEVVATVDGRWAFVANYEGEGTLSRIDLAAREEVDQIALPSSRPHGLALHPDGQRLYVTAEDLRAVLEVDVETGEVLRRLSTGDQATHMVALTPDGRRAYATSIGGGTVTALDLASGEILGQPPTGRGAEGVDVEPDGRYVWVTNREDDSVSIIEVATNQVVSMLPACAFPIRVKIAGGQALVSCAQSGEVALYDVAERARVQRLNVGDVPIGVLMTPGGTRAFVARSEGDAVSALDLERRAVVGTVDVGDTPDGLAFVPAE